MKKGDRVICITGDKTHGDWINNYNEIVDGPEYNEILIIDALGPDLNCLSFKEYPSPEGYQDVNFKKLVSDEELLEYKKNVSMKENLSPELIPKKLVTC